MLAELTRKGRGNLSNYKYMVMAGQTPDRKSPFVPADAFRPVTWMDSDTNETNMFNEAFWIVGDCESSEFFSTGSAELYAFISGDINDPGNLNADIEMWIENDRLELRSTSIVLVPAGAAHGRIKFTGVKHPVFCYHVLLSSGKLNAVPALAKMAKGSFSREKNVVERYERVDGTVPFQPFEGFLKLLLWIDGEKLPGAPYMESVWFCKPKPERDAMDIPHTHEFDEFLGIIGSDPDHPEELNGEAHIWVDGEELVTTKSFLLCVPRGMHHCPMLITKMDRPMIHFTGGNLGVYSRG